MTNKFTKDKLGRAMKTGAHEARAAAGDTMDQLRPRNILRDARDLLQKFEKNDVFRDYVVNRIWFVIPVVLVFVLVSTVCAIGIMFATARMAAPPVPVALRFFALLLGAAVWVGGIVAQTYVFLIWLEERAAQRNRAAQGLQAAVPAGVLAYLKYSRAMPPWILVVLCVVVPLVILAVYAPLMAAVLIVLAVLAPVIFSKLDS
jgi:uncharacterized membrane protein (DUF485 family)